MRRFGATGVALGLLEGHSSAGQSGRPGNLCIGGCNRHPGNEHLFLFLFQFRQVSVDRSRGLRCFPMGEGHVMANTADSIALRRLDTSGSSSDARLQSPVL